MAHKNFAVANRRKLAEPFRYFIDCSSDQRFRLHAAVAAAQRLLQHLLRLCRGLTDVNVAPQNDHARIFAASGAALAVQVGLRASLRVSESGAGNPALRQPCGSVDGRRGIGANPDLDRLLRALLVSEIPTLIASPLSP
jgi:hypothetical protein